MPPRLSARAKPIAQTHALTPNRRDDPAGRHLFGPACLVGAGFFFVGIVAAVGEQLL